MITANDESFLFWFNITKHMCHTCLYCSCHSKFSHFCISFATYLRINPKLAVLNFLLKMVHSNRVGDITLSFHCICNTNIRINLASDYNNFLGCFNQLEIFIQLMHNFSEYIYLHQLYVIMRRMKSAMRLSIFFTVIFVSQFGELHELLNKNLIRNINIACCQI